jgi:poly(hydroxyalkanoate) depolymerase family esterase
MPTGVLRWLQPPARKRTRPRTAVRPAFRVPRPPVVPRPVAVPLAPARPGRWVQGPAPRSGGRSYDVYLPRGHHRRTRTPVLVLLHGCLQTPADFADATRFTAVADRNGFLLVLPRQEGRHHPQRCWRWYEARHQRRDAGEPALLAALAREVLDERSRWVADPHRVYVAGLSAGGAMALALATTYPDVFAAVGVHSAPAYRSAVHAGQAGTAMAGRGPIPSPGPEPMPPLIVVQGGADTVVRPANGGRVARQWLAHRPDGDALRRRVAHGRTAGRSWTRESWYGARGRRVLELWQVDGLAHAWSGGRADGSFSDPAGPRAATLMWSFLRSHRL